MSLKVVYSLLFFTSVNLCFAESDHNVDLIDNTKMHEHTPMTQSEKVEAAKIGKFLDNIYADCGRYPKTDEGLNALVSKPKTFSCQKWGVKKGNRTIPYISSVPKGWKYTSDSGSSYIIEPSK